MTQPASHPRSSDDAPRLGVGLVGYGGIGRVHALAYRAIPFYYGLPADWVRIVGVATRSQKTADQAAREIGCGLATDRFAALLEHDDVHIIDCSVPNADHESVLLAAAAAGKHLYCEKPLALNTAQAMRIVRAADRAGVHTALTFNNRFFPALMRAKMLIAEGFLGRVFTFRGRYFRSGYIDAEKPMAWRLERGISGGGAWFDLGSHVVDLLVWLLGDVSSAAATLETLIPTRPVRAGSPERAAVEVDDYALVQLRLEPTALGGAAGGALGHVEVSRMGTGAPNELSIEIYGDRGALRFNAADPSWLEAYDVRDPDAPLGGTRGMKRIEAVQRYPGQRAPDWTMPPDFMRAHAECQYQFLQLVAHGAPPFAHGVASFREGLHVQAVLEAGEQAAQAGGWVFVRDVLASAG
jgi:predicted dehydrogenase